MNDSHGTERVEGIFAYWPNDLQWSSNGRSVLVSLVLRNDQLGLAAVLIEPGGGIKFVTFGGEDLAGLVCHARQVEDTPEAWYDPHSPLPPSSGETIIADVSCNDASGQYRSGYLVFGASGDFLRVDSRRELAIEWRRSEPFRQAVHGGELGEQLAVEWSPSGRQALIFDLEAASVWVYNAIDGQLQFLKHDAGAISPDAWDAESPWAVKWDVYWLGLESAAVIPRLLYDLTLGGLLIDLRSGVGEPLDHELFFNWPCLATGAWHPAGELFQVGFYRRTHADIPSHCISSDGTMPYRENVSQRIIIRRDGSSFGALRTIGGRAYTAAQHQASWSPSGDWFAIGGHQELGRCVFGS